MDDTPDELDELDAFISRRQARRRTVVRVLVIAASVGLVFVGLQWVLQRELRQDAARRGIEALGRYAASLQSSHATLASSVEQRFLAAAVRGTNKPDFSEAREACRDLDDAIDDMPGGEEVDLVACQTIADLGQCRANFGTIPDAVEQHLEELRRCSEQLVQLGDELSSPEVSDGELMLPPTPFRFPALPPGDELYGKPVWYPTPRAVVATIWLRNEERCFETPQTEALDCKRPATFVVQGDVVSELTSFPMPKGFRGWRVVTVDADGAFLGLVQGPGKQQVIVRDPGEAPRRVTLPWGDEPQTEAQLEKPAWLAEAWRALERKPPPSVPPAYSDRPEASGPDARALKLAEGVVVSVHLVDAERLVFARGEDQDRTWYRDLGELDSSSPSRVSLTGTPEGVLVVSWEVGTEYRFIWSPDGGRTWIGARERDGSKAR